MNDREDPNADLIGHKFLINDREWTVTKTPVWNDGNYVEIESEIGRTVRPAGLVRKNKFEGEL